MPQPNDTASHFRDVPLKDLLTTAQAAKITGHTIENLKPISQLASARSPNQWARICEGWKISFLHPLSPAILHGGEGLR